MGYAGWIESSAGGKSTGANRILGGYCFDLRRGSAACADGERQRDEAVSR